MPEVVGTTVTELPCPNCGSELAYLEQYRRHYCYRCQRYAPEGYGDRGAQHCPNCGGILAFVAQYDRFYCYHCNSYPNVPAQAEAKPAETPKAASAADAPTAPITPAATEAPAAATETKPAEPAVPATAAPVESAPAAETPRPSPEPAPQPAPEAAVQEPSPEPALESKEEKPAAPEELPQSPYASMKPAALRVKLFALKKAELMDLCKVYALDPTGTKEHLQERLLVYLRDRESKESDTEWIPKAAEAQAEPAALPPTPATEAPKTETIAMPPSAPAAKPVAIVQAKLPEPEGAPVTAPASAAQTALLEEPKPEPAPHAAEEPALITVTPGPAGVPVVVEEEAARPKAAHPCPTCGRELSYVSQYDRWYCYFCQRYAPAAKAVPKFACPTCGATLRWISQYERWWCDRCERYAPADLPRPKGPAPAATSAVASTAAAAAATPEAATRVVRTHRHGSPMGGIGLIVLGLITFVFLQAVTTLPLALGYASPVVLTASDVALLDFLAFVLVAGGAIFGLAMARRQD